MAHSLYENPEALLMSEEDKQALCVKLNHILADERVDHGEEPFKIPSPEVPFHDQWLAFRSMVNIREAWPCAPRFLKGQDRLLQALIAEAGVVGLDQAEPAPCKPGTLYHWQGDITTLATDSIVNAANSHLTGCWAPLHYCIDNAIHTFAGVQLRLACDKIMRAQGHFEPTAQAKVTGAYNLPSTHVIHTVGPIAQGHPTDLHREQLAQCYAACLDAAVDAGDGSIAFCRISTGVFGFPQAEAASIAVASVNAWLESHPDSRMKVVFNTYLDSDAALYRNLLELD